MGAEMDPHAVPRAVPVSFRATPLQRSCGSGGGQRRSPPPTRCLPAKTPAAGPDFLRSAILGRAFSALEKLAHSADVRPSRHRRRLATRLVSQILGNTVKREAASSRQTYDSRRDTAFD